MGMGKVFEIHRHMKDVEGALRRCEEDAAVSPENRKAIASFARDRLAKGVGRLRVSKCVYCLRYLAGWLKIPFADATKDDLIGLVGSIEGKPYADASKKDFKAVLKLFYKWLKGNDEIFPPEIAWLRLRMKNVAHKLPEELVTEDEVLQMAGKTFNLRDKAFVLVLYETGCRIGELMSLRMKHVLYDQYGAILRVTGKTGDRRVRIISSAPALSAWMQMHAKRDDPESTLWPPLSCSHHYQPHCADHQSLYKLLKELGARAGIRKRIYPHLFRHSRATALAGKLTEAQMKEYFGWTQSSDMASVYVHLSGRNVDDAMLALQGMAKPAEKKEERMLVQNCPRCQEKNSPDSKFCVRCGSPMEVRIMMEAEKDRKSGDDVMNSLMQNSEVREFLLRKVVEMGLEKRLA